MRPENLCIFCMHEKNDPNEVCSNCGHRNEDYKPGKDHLPPFTVLNGHYLLGRAIGEGGFAIAYIAMDLYLETVVAIKELFPTGYVTRDQTGHTHKTAAASIGVGTDIVEESRKKFIQEARTLAQMKTKIKGGIVNVSGFFEEFGTAYMVMEYLDGTDLKAYLANVGKMPAEQVLNLMKPVIFSMKQIHDAGIIHRDISPDNIMLLRSGEIRVLDFGGVRDACSDEKSQMLILKPGYSPIEQYQAQGKIGPWTDVYALCATIYRCLTGVRLPESVERAEIRVKPPSEYGVRLSPKAEKTLMKGLEVSPERRLQNMQQLYDGLYGDEQVSMPMMKPEPTPKPAVGWLYKAAMGMAGVAVIALCAVGGLAVYRQFGGGRGSGGGLLQAVLKEHEEMTDSAIVILDPQDETQTQAEDAAAAQEMQAAEAGEQTAAALATEAPEHTATEPVTEAPEQTAAEPATEAPAPATEESVTEAPAPATEAPAPATEAPAPATEAPAPATEAPVTEAPAPATEAPAPAIEAPVPATEAPAPATEAPVPATEASAPAAEVPVPATEAPAPATEAPVPVTEAPVQPVTEPATEAPNNAALYYASDVYIENLRAVLPDTIDGSSYIEGGEYDYHPYRCMDGDDVSSWQTEDYAVLWAYFSSPRNVKAIRFRVGNWRSEEHYWQNCRPRTLAVSIGAEMYTVAFEDEMQEFVLLLDRPIATDSVTFSIEDIYTGTLTDDICITEITIYEGA